MLPSKIRSVTVCRAVLLAVVSLGGCGTDALYEFTTPEPAVRLPGDEAPHCFGGEWWYYTGRVVTEDGRPFGIEAAVFHDARLPLLVFIEGWAAHFAVFDESTGQLVYDQGRWLGAVATDCSNPDGFRLDTPLVQMSGAGGQDHLHAAMADGSYAIDLLLADERGVVLHGESGYVSYGPFGRSFYYSRPVMRIAGTLHIDGEPHDVDGHLWFDRQWGHDLQDPWLRWDWFSLRLDDGSNVMLFIFRDAVPVVAHGTFIPASGPPRPLGEQDFVITPTATWVSPHTGATYPVAWDIDVLSEDLRVTVTAVANDQELDARSTTLNVYWEGLCDLTGTHAGQTVNGTAYVELTNYVR